LRIHTCVRPVTALALVALCMAASGTPGPDDAQATASPHRSVQVEPATGVSATELPIAPARISLPHPRTERAAVVSVAAPRPTGGEGIPVNVLAAYRAAEAAVARTHPGCHLAWHHLAGIGIVESGHARGGQATPSGDTAPRILGPRLNGGPGIAAIPDTDRGHLDSDTVWDRAVGPMQFIPSTWAAYGTDANGDGKADPHNLTDAAASAGHYLCAGDMDLANPSDLSAAIFRYNHSMEYVATVMSWMHAYSDGATPVPALPAGPTETPVMLTSDSSEKPNRPVQTPAPVPSPAPERPLSGPETPEKPAPGEDEPAEEPTPEEPAEEPTDGPSEQPTEQPIETPGPNTIELDLPCGALAHLDEETLPEDVLITENCESPKESEADAEVTSRTPESTRD
jgi:membrane-bound lytic murein transglycosylase B